MEVFRPLKSITAGSAFRGITLALVLVVSVWALLPPRDEAAEGSRDAGASETRHENVRFVLRLNPGAAYLPGYRPFGIGKPLEGLTRVLRAFEKRFPDTRVEIVTVPVAAREYLVTQLSSGKAPDIVTVNVEDVWVDVQKQWYIPLDRFLEAPNPFVREKGDPGAAGYDQWWDMFKYQAISRGKAAPDGLNYCLSFDMVETGIYYNKDVFAEVGVDVPETWEAFIEVMQAIQAAGYVPLLANIDMFADWCTDMFFDQLYNDLLPGIDLYQDPTREAYLAGYLDDFEVCFLFEKGFFTKADPRYREVWRLMREFRQYCNENLTAPDLIREFVTQKAAMVWFPCQLTYRLNADKDLGFDWGTFYLPPFTKQTTQYASETPMCVIGGSAAQFEVTNSAIGDTPAGMPFEERIATSERLRRAIQLLQFLTVPENCAEIVNEYECFLPNIIGVPVMPALKPFEAILERRYTTTKWVYTFDLKFAEIQRRMLELYLNDGVDLDEFMDWQVGNIAAATANFKMRKGVDAEMLEQAWDARAPMRAQMEDLPNGAT